MLQYYKNVSRTFEMTFATIYYYDELSKVNKLKKYRFFGKLHIEQIERLLKKDGIKVIEVRDIKYKKRTYTLTKEEFVRYAEKLGKEKKIRRNKNED